MGDRWTVTKEEDAGQVTRPYSVMSFAKRLGPYYYAAREQRTFENGRTFTLLLSTAYNAYGLIGPEMNGIVVLDDDNMVVVLDQECQEQTGYFGPSERQLKRWSEVLAMDWAAFQQWVNGHKRLRQPIGA